MENHLEEKRRLRIAQEAEQALAHLTPIERAKADLEAGRPLPGLPDLRRPVFLKPEALVCQSLNALANPNIDILLLIGACSSSEQAIQVQVVQPRDSELYLTAHMVRAIRVVWRSTAMSDASIGGGWVKIENLAN